MFIRRVCTRQAPSRFKRAAVAKTRQTAANRYATVLRHSKIQTYCTQHPTPATTEELSETFLSGTSGAYVDAMYESWQKDATSVHSSWAAFFDAVQKGAKPGQAVADPPTMGGYAPQHTPSRESVGQTLRLSNLVRSWQVAGHLVANIDPLGLMDRKAPPELKYEYYEFSEQDLDRTFDLPETGNMTGYLTGGKKTMREILELLKRCYAGDVGYEYMHINSRLKCNFIRQQIEKDKPYEFSQADKLNLLDRLMWATEFEQYIGIKYGNAKRFGVDGSEVLIPGMKTMIDEAADAGVKEIVIGMSHRGRLNVLANVVRKPHKQIFYEFKEGSVDRADYGSVEEGGDVKYHLGASYNRPTRDNKGHIHISLASNPSHLEAVNPVVEGKAKAKQYWRGDTDGSQVMSVLIHGDAAFAGQGVVYEVMNITQTRKFSTGGTIHIIVNNQIGFTTDTSDARGGNYCTDVCKSAEAPIFHVNADNPEAVIHCFKLAVAWRTKFKSDAVIDIVGYRRFGHNEGDEPMFTQPMMYTKIHKHISVATKYAKQLVAEGIITDEEVSNLKKRIHEKLNAAHQEAKEQSSFKLSDWLESKWEGFKSPERKAEIKTTGVPLDRLKEVGKAISTIPKDIKLHSRIKRVYESRLKNIESGQDIDFGFAEALAFSTLLQDGVHVHLSGQDCERGTFAHRHAIVHDQKTGKLFTPLENTPNKKENLVVANSPLSEFGCLGFSLGYSAVSPKQLVIWEAQFGDFANGAQVIIDQFLSAGEAKWYRQSGLVLLLPHGYEGMGPEHSSARVERFLQLCDSDPDFKPDPTEKNIGQLYNMGVVNCSCPANYFHALRRQVHREYRKPLIVFTHKSILRTATSRLDEFDDIGDDTKFFHVIDDSVGPGSVKHESLAPADKIRRVIFCTGKVFYDLHNYRQKNNINDVALVRIEQLCPFHFTKVTNIGNKYANAEFMWVQEEPKNMGAWTYIRPHIDSAIRDCTNPERARIRYMGRHVTASPACASAAQHKREVAEYLEGAFA